MQSSCWRAARPCVRLLNAISRRSLAIDASTQRGGQTDEGASAASRLSAIIDLTRKLSGSANGAPRQPARLRGVGSWADIQGKQHEAHADDTPTTSELPRKRKFGDAFVRYSLPFEEDATLREAYVGGGTTLRLGRLMEDLDSLAGAVSYRYVLPDDAPVTDARKHGFYLVTAAVDRLDMLRPIDPLEPENMQLSGFVSFASRSSLEVLIQLASVSKKRGRSVENPEPILIGRFTMACRSAKGGAHAIPELELESEDERTIFELGREQKERKKALAAKSLDVEPPNEDEMRQVHRFRRWLEPQAELPKELVWMSDTRLQTSLLQHPQERNVHGKIFGGFLMRMAYEHAFATASLFARSRVVFLALDELAFVKPVEIGKLLSLDAHISFAPIQAGHRSFSVTVEASTINLHSGERQLTNVFNFTFQTTADSLDRFVVPRSFLETLSWAGALRRRTLAIQLRKDLMASGKARSR